MAKDIMQNFGDIYSITAPFVIGKAHDRLLCWLDECSQKYGESSLLVLGPGKCILPYSYKPEKLMTLGGPIVMQDYSLSVIFHINEYIKGGGLGTFDISDKSRNNIKEDSFPYIALVRSDIKNGLPYFDNSFDMVDASLVLHHVTPFYSDLEYTISECYRVLKPGGSLHIIEGNVDMSCENKLKNILEIVSKNNQKSFLFDYRLDNRSYILKNGSFTKKNEKKRKTCSLFVNRDGTIDIKKDNINYLFNEIKSYGYSINYLNKDKINLPLIEKEKDNRLLERINLFYDKIYELSANSNISKDIIQQHKEAIEYEMSNAKRGIIEYYRKPWDYLIALENVGFTNIDMNLKRDEPFYTITAGK